MNEFNEKIRAEVTDRPGSVTDEVRRGPGRPPRVPLDAAAASAAAQRMALEAEEVPPRRPVDRKPFGVHEQNLAWPDIPGFRLYWFNDTPGRIARAKSAGYEHVLDESGSPVTRNVGKAESGGGINGYLMKIPKQWYEEDMADSQRALAEKLGDIRNGRNLADHQYTGKQGIKIEERR